MPEASEHLQFLREYSGILQDPYPLYEDIERLYISAHGVAGTGGTYGYQFFHEVAGKLAHIFQYAMNATISPEATAPLVEFIYEAIAVLESDLIMVSATGVESVDDIAAFKQRYPFAFQAAAACDGRAHRSSARDPKPCHPKLCQNRSQPRQAANAGATHAYNRPQAVPPTHARASDGQITVPLLQPVCRSTPHNCNTSCSCRCCTGCTRFCSCLPQRPT